MNTFITGAQNVFNGVFGTGGIGSTLITWMTAEGHELVLLPLIMWLMIGLVGLVRRLIPGV